MNYIKARVKDPYLGDLSVDNFFISELMPDAPGDYVKVYLYGRMLAEGDGSLDPKEMADQLGLTEDKVLEAWDYWEDFDVIKKRYIDGEGRLDFAVEFTNLKELLFGASDGKEAGGPSKFGLGADPAAAKGAFGNEAVKDLMDQIEKKLSRPLGVAEMQTIISWIEDIKAPPEVILQGFDYCLGKSKSNFRYISAVIEGWLDQGLNTQEKVLDYIEEYDQKFVRYRRVMQALGLSRNPTEEERRIMDTWFQDMGYKLDKVLEACAKTAGISNPNVRYVNSVLVNWQKGAVRDNRDINDKESVTNTELKEYYDFLHEKADKEADERRSKLYEELPEIKTIDERMRDIGIKLAKSLLGGNEDTSASLNSELERLNEDRAILLVENNYDVNFTDPRYKCSHCNDTGIGEMGGSCDYCKGERRKEAEIWIRERDAAK